MSNGAVELLGVLLFESLSNGLGGAADRVANLFLHGLPDEDLLIGGDEALALVAQTLQGSLQLFKVAEAASEERFRC
jgi:hypothetical protein